MAGFVAVMWMGWGEAFFGAGMTVLITILKIQNLTGTGKWYNKSVN